MEDCTYRLCKKYWVMVHFYHTTIIFDSIIFWLTSSARCFNLVQIVSFSILISSFNTIFSHHLIFLALNNLITPFPILNRFLYFLGNTILKNSSNQLLVFGIFSFSMNESVASKSFFKFRRNFPISSGKYSI